MSPELVNGDTAASFLLLKVKHEATDRHCCPSRPGAAKLGALASGADAAARCPHTAVVSQVGREVPAMMRKLVVIGLQQTFLQLVYEQLEELTAGALSVRAVSLNELPENPLLAGETVLYFSPGLKPIVANHYPHIQDYIRARRENLIFNMRDLFALESGCRILVVNDVKTNTDEMTEDLGSFGLPHTFFPYYPGEPLPDDIDLVVTAGERSLVPKQLKDKPLLDLGQRFISLESVYELFDHFQLPYTNAALARHYMRTVMMLSEKWPVLGKERFRRPYWFGIRQDTSAPVTFADLVVKSEAMRLCCEKARMMAATVQPVHITGEIGTGKMRIAQAIHNASACSGGPFISINCGARIPEILEKELFGWENGATTYRSLFETAENGTLCIEEIGNLTQGLQTRLLQAVTEKRIIRTDGLGAVDITVRLISIASRPLEKLPAGAFDPGLLLMITQHICPVPPLRERLPDLEELIADYLAKQLHRPQLVIPDETMAALRLHPWKGNVQELYHVLQHAVCISGDVLEKRNLPYYLVKDSEKQQRTNRLAETHMAGQEADLSSLALDIVAHGFLGEAKAILAIYRAGKEKNQAYGRSTVLDLLRQRGVVLSRQQLRLKLERMNRHGLFIVRPGRGGTTISGKGERFLKFLAETPSFS